MRALPEMRVSRPCGIEAIDKDWGVGVSAMWDNDSPYPRINRLRERIINGTYYSVDAERACLLTEAYQKFDGETQIIKCAKSLAYIMENIPIDIYDDELIVGNAGAPPNAGPIFPEFSLDWIINEIENFPFMERAHDQYYSSPETDERLKAIHPYWQGRTVSDRILNMMDEDENKGTASVGKGVFLLLLYMYGGVGHVSPNYDFIFCHGWSGLRKRVEDKLAGIDPHLPADLKRRDFYRAELIVIDAVINYIKRYAVLAGQRAERAGNDQRRQELEAIAANLAWTAENPPRNFYEVMQLWYFVSNIILIESNGHSVSYGRIDQYLYPFYRRDVDAGLITKDFAQELIEAQLLKIQELMKIRDMLTVDANSGRHVGGSCITLGGQDTQGFDATNDLTYMFLDALPHTRLAGPWNAVRFHANSPRDLWVKVTKIVKMGMGEPKIFNDEVIIPAMTAKGRSLEDARDYCVVGCVEVDAAGREYGWHDAAYFSMSKILELAINNGRCLACGEHCPRHPVCAGAGGQLGLATGSLADFKGFDEVLTAYDSQMKYWCDLMTRCINIMDLAHQQLKPLPYLSLLVDDCIDRGLDVSAGGAKYNFSGPQGVGVGTVADGLAAIKQLVFEEGRVSGADLLEALEKNWEGFETLCALVNSEKVHHYGNDDDYADELARFAFDTYCKHIEGRPTAHGGVFQPGVYSVSANVPIGQLQWASPDGRQAGEAVSDCLGAVHTKVASHDVKGPTAIAMSVTKLNHARAGNGTLLNWKFTPAALTGETGEQNFIDLMQTFFQRKGLHSQFNVVSRETLLDAQANPLKYGRGLYVRVAGYSAPFTELSRSLQDDIIGRTELSFD